MDERVLIGNHRADFGKAAARRCRDAGRLPAIVYDRNGHATAIDVPYREFRKLFKTVTESTLITVKLSETESFDAFIKDYQYDIAKDEVYHVDFYAIERGKTLRTKIQVRLAGSPEICRQGAVLETGVTEIEVECLPRDLPERIVVDVSKLGANEVIHVRDIQIAKEVKVLSDPDLAVAIVKFTKADIPALADAAENA